MRSWPWHQIIPWRLKISKSIVNVWVTVYLCHQTYVAANLRYENSGKYLQKIRQPMKIRNIWSTFPFTTWTVPSSFFRSTVKLARSYPSIFLRLLTTVKGYRVVDPIKLFPCRPLKGWIRIFGQLTVSSHSQPRVDAKVRCYVKLSKSIYCWFTWYTSVCT